MMCSGFDLTGPQTRVFESVVVLAATVPGGALLVPQIRVAWWLGQLGSSHGTRIAEDYGRFEKPFGPKSLDRTIPRV